jgi:dTDP-4-dehydrorhamnose reductase
MIRYVKPRLLVTGGTGFVGYHLMKNALLQFEVHYIAHTSISPINEVFAHHVSLNDFLTLEQKIKQLRPDYIIHLAADANANHCETFPWSSWKINVEASKHLALIAGAEDIKLCFASSDLVFDGTKGNYKETDVPNPINKYGAQKWEAEKIILSLLAKAVVFRLPLMFGNTESKRSHLMQMLQQLRSQQEVKLFTDEYRSICGVNSVTRGMLSLMDKAQGVYHLGGKERMSRYDFGVMAAKIFGCPTHLIKPCLQKNIPMPAPRPKDVSLNSEKAIYLGFRPLGAEEELRLIAHESTLN